MDVSVETIAEHLYGTNEFIIFSKTKQQNISKLGQ